MPIRNCLLVMIALPMIMGCARSMQLSTTANRPSLPTRIPTDNINVADNTVDKLSFSTLSVTIENKKEYLRNLIHMSLSDPNAPPSSNKIFVTFKQFSVTFLLGTYTCNIAAEFSVTNNGENLYSKTIRGTGTAFNTWPNSYEESVANAMNNFVADIPTQEIQMAFNGSTHQPSKNTTIALIDKTSSKRRRSSDNIAILPLDGNGVDASVPRTLTDLLINTMQSNGCYNVLERDQVDKILQEQGFQNSGACSATECAIEMGKLLSVRMMAIGSIGKLGNSYILNIRMADVQTGEVLSNSSKKITGGIENSADAISEIVDDLCTQ